MFFMNLLNRRILVVEEDNTRASSVSAALEFQGSDVVGPFHSLREGLDAVKQVEIDAAVLDVCLGEERVYSLDAVMGRRLTSSQLGGCPSE